MSYHLTAHDFIATVEDEGPGYTLLGYYCEETLHEIENRKLRKKAVAAQAALQELMECIEEVKDAEVDWLSQREDE
jgi:hypothetical protein